MADPYLTPFSKPTTHSLVTDDDFMRGLGLGTCTTGILYAYFCARDPQGNYVNRQIIRDKDNNEINSWKQIFGDPDSGDVGDDWGTWYGFRQQDVNVGKYEEQNYLTWELDEVIDIQKGLTVNYDIDTNWFLYFGPQFNEMWNVNSTSYGVNSSQFWLSNRYPVLYDYPIFQTNPDLRVQDLRFIEGQGDPITSIIQMNEFMIDATEEYARSRWEELPRIFQPEDDGRIESPRFGSIWSFGTNTMFALDEYLTDIKSSQNGGVSFSGLLTFNTVLADGNFTCSQQRWVKWDLYLEDEVPDPVEAQPVIIPSKNLVAEYAKDETGRNTYNMVNGEVETADETDPSQKVVAPQKLNYNEYLDQYESGTSQMMAIVTSGGAFGNKIPAAVNVPPVTTLEQSTDQDEVLNGDDLQLKFIPSTGYVMPIYMQNGNPSQWSPKFAEDSDCKGPADALKQTVVGYNFNPKKEYEKGDLVYINQVGGVWHITDPGDGGLDGGVPFAVEGWNFTQYATNAEFFFRQYKEAGRLDPAYVERQLHVNYYKDDDNNQPQEYNLQFSTLGLEVTGLQIQNGAWQISSWDFMDSQIFGTRARFDGGSDPVSADKNAIAQTLADVDPAGNTIPLGDTFRNAAHTLAYFGAAFPDGWIVPGDYDDVDEDGAPTRDFLVVPVVPEDCPDLVAQGLQEFFSEDNGTQKPFFDEVVDAGNGREKWDRNDVMLAYNEDIFNPDFIGPEGANEKYLYKSNRFSFSMFSAYNDGTDKSLKHLPADIATNGSFTSQYGSPLYNIYRTARIYTHPGFQSTPQGGFNPDLPDAVVAGNAASTDSVKNTAIATRESFNEYVYLAKQGDGYDADASAFAFAPRNPSRVQFRPLKMEAYAAYHPLVNPTKQLNPKEKFQPGCNNGADTGSNRNLYVPDELVSCIETNDPFIQGRNVEAKYPLMPWRRVGGQVSPCGGESTDSNFPYPNVQRGSWSAFAARQTITQTNICDQVGVLNRNCNLNRGVLPPVYQPLWGVRANYNGEWKAGKDLPETSSGGGKSLAFKYKTGRTGGVACGLAFLKSDFNGPRDDDAGQIITAPGYSKFPATLRVHEGNYWNNTTESFSWMDFGTVYSQSEDLVPGAGGYGVIAAQCTCSTNTELSFEVKSLIGFLSESVGFLGEANEYFPVWGSINDAHFSENTANLCTTVYQWSPRNQQIFDQLTFAVHHFNPGVQDEGWVGFREAGWGIGGAAWVGRYRCFPTRGFEAYYPYFDVQDRVVDGASVQHRVYRDVTDGIANVEEVGMYEPAYYDSFSDDPAQTFAQPFAQGTLVFRDQSTNLNTPCATRDAFFNPSRIGKLLPYRYKQYVYGVALNPQTISDPANTTLKIGSTFDSGLGFYKIRSEQQVYDDFGFDNEDNPDLRQINVDDLLNTMVVVSEGAGYLVGDLIGNGSYGITYQVTGIGEEGNVTAWEIYEESDGVYQWGEMPHTAAVSSDTVLDFGDVAGIQISTISSVTGTGFQAYFVNCVVSVLTKVDQKPLYLTREKLISATNQQPSEKQESPFGFVNQTDTTTILIEQTNAVSPVSKYDLYFWFHNSTNMTWMSSALDFFGNGRNPNAADEQFIEVIITGK